MNIALVFSGGISKGAYQVGFLKSLFKYVDKEEIKVVTGASMGLLCAYALSADKLDEFEFFWRSVDFGKRSQLFYQVFFKKLIRRTIDGFVSFDDELKIPFCFPVCYVPIWNVKYYWLKGAYNAAWKKYFYAALNYPFLHILPSVLNKRLAIDGGAADNIPIFPVLHSGAQFVPDGGELDLILVLHFDARYDYRRQFATNIPVLDVDLSICNGFKKRHHDFSAQYIAEMIEQAEIYGNKICEKLFSGDCTKEELQQAIDQIFLEEYSARQKQVSLDRFFSMLNVIGRVLRNDNSCEKYLY